MLVPAQKVDGKKRPLLSSPGDKRILEIVAVTVYSTA
jgi:hypothetical protein